MKKEENHKDKAVKFASILIILSAILLFIYLAQSILIPLFLGVLFAILLLPIVLFFKRKLHFPDLLSVTITCVFAFSFIVLVILVLSKQIGYLFEDLPQIQKNLYIHLDNLHRFIESIFHISSHNQNALLLKTMKSGNFLSSNSFQSLGNLTGILFNLILIPIYTFLILMYRANFLSFVHAFELKKDRKTTSEILHKINTVVRQYILGLFIEMLIVAVLMGFGLWIIGVKYFLFLAILTALLNLIPYIGILIACTISILITIVGSTDLNLIIGVIVVNIVVQLIDNNFLIPKVVGSKISINAFASMVGVIVGGAIAGVGGMFLALPSLAILKVIFDHVENLKPFGHLIGEEDKK